MPAEHEIKVSIDNLKKILASDDNLYQIPNYQRPYSWSNDHLAELIDDLVAAYTESKNEKYFCGSLVLAENASAERFDVIDGQQRITTFIIMACVFRDVYGSKLDSKAVSYVNESVKKRFGDEEKLRFMTGDNYHTFFQEAVLEKIDFTKPIRKNNRYLENAHCIKNLLNENIADSVSIADFVNWLYENVVLTVIVCGSEDGAIRIFDVLNSRGMPLTPVDILKARLMHKLSKEDRESFSTTWHQIDNRLKDQNFKIEDMLDTYLYYKKAPNSKRRLDKELHDVFKKEERGALNIISELDQFADVYLYVLEENDKYRYCLQYLNNRIYWSSILVTAKFEKYLHTTDLKPILVAYFYQNWISGSNVTRIKQTCLNVLNLVKDGRPIEAVKEEMQKNLNKYETTEKFHKELRSNYVYGRKWDRPLLLLIEYFSVDNSSNGFVKLENKLHIEHVLPQKPNDDWKDIFSQEELEKWTHSLANLTLLSGKKDSQARNFSFPKKKEVYQCVDGVSSSFYITQDIANNYDKWDVCALEKRQTCLLKKVKEKLDLFE